MAIEYDRTEIKAALALTDPAMSSYLDLHTGKVVRINDADTGAETERLRDAVMEGYGDQYRYIPGGNTAADEAAVQAWMEAEGL